MPGGPENPVLGGVEYKHPLPPPGSIPAGGQPSTVPPFIASRTVVYAPSLPEVNLPLIASRTTLYTPSVGNSGNFTVTTAGTYTWICPAGVSTAFVEAYGGGGGGGDGEFIREGAGGGGGAYAARFAVPVTPGTAYTFVVGAAGTHGDPAAGAGGNSTFTGDSGVQVIAVGGGGAGAGGDIRVGGVGGAAASCTGDTGHKFSGGNGGNGGSVNGGGGGASGNHLAAGANGGNGSDLPTPGLGGVGANGGGSGGHGAQGPVTAGSNPGGGGGGGSPGNNGANGASGKVTIIVGVLAPYIDTKTHVYTPELLPLEPPFISSHTIVYPPQLPHQVRPPFIPSHTVVYKPLGVGPKGIWLSQLPIEVASVSSHPRAVLGQITVEVARARTGMHIWQRD